MDKDFCLNVAYWALVISGILMGGYLFYNGFFGNDAHRYYYLSALAILISAFLASVSMMKSLIHSEKLHYRNRIVAFNSKKRHATYFLNAVYKTCSITDKSSVMLEGSRKYLLEEYSNWLKHFIDNSDIADYLDSARSHDIFIRLDTIALSMKAYNNNPDTIIELVTGLKTTIHNISEVTDITLFIKS